MTQRNPQRSQLIHGLDPATLANPYPRYRQLRELDPVHWHQGLQSWLVTRYSDVRAALRDPRLSANRINLMLQDVPDEAQQAAQALDAITSRMMLYSDPPDHTRLRALAHQVLTPGLMGGIRTRIQAIVNRLLDKIEPAGKMDAINDLAYPLPAMVICELLDLPATDYLRLRKWSRDFIAFLGNVRLAAYHMATAKHSADEMLGYLDTIIDERRHRPGDDLISAMITRVREGDGFSQAELQSMLVLLICAGHETTTNLIGNGLLALLQNPEQLRDLRDGPGLIEAAIEEMLRYDSPIQSTGRVALVDLEIGEERIRQGQSVSLILGSANRDATEFPDPDRLDFQRKNDRHLAFGFGAHFCLGAALGRLEGQVAFEGILSRLPGLRLAAVDLEWQDNPVFRGLKALPVEF